MTYIANRWGRKRFRKEQATQKWVAIARRESGNVVLKHGTWEACVAFIKAQQPFEAKPIYLERRNAR